jgi:MSHA pilin protein MshD
MSGAQHKTQGGFTLIETIIVIVLVGAMMAGMTALFVQNVGKSHRPYLRQRTVAVANSFLDEILHKRWNENTPLGGGCVNTGTGTCPTGPVPAAIGNDGETRASFDDIDDYHGLAQSPPQDSSGNDMPGYAGFSVSVNVSQPGASWNGISAADVRLIEVAVTSSSNETISLSAYRVNH